MANQFLDKNGLKKLWAKIKSLLSAKADSSNVYTKSETDSKVSAKANASDVYTRTETDSKISGKQDKLVSGTNIKTINGNSVLGSGNVSISGTDSTKLPLSGGTMTGDIVMSGTGKLRFSQPNYGLGGISITTTSVYMSGTSVGNEAYVSVTAPSNSASGSWYCVCLPYDSYCSWYTCESIKQGVPNGTSCKIACTRLISGTAFWCKIKVIWLKIW